MELPSSFSESIRFDFFHVDYQGVFPQHQAEQKCCEPHEQRFKARSRPLSSESTGRAVPVPPPAAQPYQVVRLCQIVAKQSSKRHCTKPGTFFGAIIAQKGSGFLFCVIFLRVATTKWDKQNNSRQNHSNQRLILRFHMSSAGGEPVLCLQKGILSPSCLPAFGKADFRSLYRFISHCERDFSFASEGDSHFFDKTILPHFSPHVNHVKLFHLFVLDLRSVRGPGLPPGRSPCPDALLRVGVMRGG